MKQQAKRRDGHKGDPHPFHIHCPAPPLCQGVPCKDAPAATGQGRISGVLFYVVFVQVPCPTAMALLMIRPRLIEPRAKTTPVGPCPLTFPPAHSIVHQHLAPRHDCGNAKNVCNLVAFEILQTAKRGRYGAAHGDLLIDRPPRSIERPHREDVLCPNGAHGATSEPAWRAIMVRRVRFLSGAFHEEPRLSRATTARNARPSFDRKRAPMKSSPKPIIGKLPRWRTAERTGALHQMSLARHAQA